MHFPLYTLYPQLRGNDSLLFTIVLNTIFGLAAVAKKAGRLPD